MKTMNPPRSNPHPALRNAFKAGFAAVHDKLESMSREEREAFVAQAYRNPQSTPGPLDAQAPAKYP